MYHVDVIEKCHQRRRLELPAKAALLHARSTESASIQTLRQNAATVAIAKQDADLIASLVEENKQPSFAWVGRLVDMLNIAQKTP